MSHTLAEIVLDGAIGSFDKRYTYLVPDELLLLAKRGCRVTVPFGRGNTKKQGMIMDICEGESSSGMKNIYSVTDSAPILNDEMIKMCEWMHSHIFCTYFDAIHAMLPAGLNYRLADYYLPNEEFSAISLLDESEREIYDFLLENGETPLKKLQERFDNTEDVLLNLTKKEAVVRNSIPVRRMNDLTRRYLRLKGDGIPSSVKLTERQREVMELVEAAGGVSVKELQYFTGASQSVINSLITKGVCECFEKQEFRIPYKASKDIKKNEITLTDEQQAAYEGLKSQAFSDKAEAALLYGVTGSGKTQVFLKLADDVSREGLGVIIMVPEIALTPQMIRIFSERYGDKVAVFHSAMSLGQRMDEYNRIKQGKALIAVGTRSAVFAPFSRLGLVIIDEEQEHTYKSEKTPRFHARDVARFRVGYHKGLLLLASATPSIESYSAAQNGNYTLYRLTHRYGNAVLPQVRLIDMRKELSEGNASDISRELATLIGEAIDNGKQAIILLNRRGHNTYISCRECGWVAQCDSCSVSLTYHSANHRLMCHYCGRSEPKPNICPQCGSEHIAFSGSGTQRLEEELQMLFPKARILRLDADSTATRDSYSVNLTAFANGEYDIMLGTQMVAKGLDFPNVTVVGVIGADRALYSDDYRGFERTFSLLTQVVGRAGRAQDSGIAVVQTNDTDNNVITLAGKQDYDAFYNEEILNRKLMIFPPFCDICMLSVSSSDSADANRVINEIFSAIKERINSEYSDIKLIILGPCAASVPRVNGKYRYRMIIKCRNTTRFRELLNEVTGIKLRRDTSVSIDMNPETLI